MQQWPLEGDVCWAPCCRYITAGRDGFVKARNSMNCLGSSSPMSDIRKDQEVNQ